jgi:hypothetical protein
MLGAFTYLGKLGLKIWDEVGMVLQPVSQPGHMTLGSNALHNLHILIGVVLLSCSPRLLFSVLHQAFESAAEAFESAADALRVAV